MPRPRKPGALTGAERAKASKERRQVVSQVELTADLINRLALIRARDGDGTNAAVVARLIHQSSIKECND